jgi:hypothetical protein
VARLLDAFVVAFVVAAALCFTASIYLFIAKRDGAALYTLALGALASKTSVELVRRGGGS